MSGFIGIITNSSLNSAINIAHYGSWAYILIFMVILLGSSFIITPLPGNSLLFVSGALAVQGRLSLMLLFICSTAAAYIGYDINYWSGRIMDVAVCKKGCPHIFDDTNIRKSHDLMTRYGQAAIIISRFIPVVNLPPFFAGLDRMDYSRYIGMNLTGAVMWTSLVLALGYIFGGIPVVSDILPLLVGIVIILLVITLLYAFFAIVRNMWLANKDNQDQG